jgi:hypothetical protein
MTVTVSKATAYVALVNPAQSVSKQTAYVVLLKTPAQHIEDVSFSGSGFLELTAGSPSVFPETISRFSVAFEGSGFLSVTARRNPPFDCDEPEPKTWTRNTPVAASWARVTPVAQSWVCVGDEVADTGRCFLLLASGDLLLRLDGGRLTLIECDDEESEEGDGSSDSDDGDGSDGDGDGETTGGGGSTDPGFYSTGVIAGSLQSVVDLKTTAGYVTAPTKTPVSNAAELVSAGVTIGSGVLTFGSTFALSGFDFTGWELVFGAVTGTLTGCKIAKAHLVNSPYHISFSSTGADITLSHCTGDFTVDQTGWGGCHVTVGNIVRPGFSHWTGASIGHFFGAGRVIGTDCYLGPPGNLPDAFSHIEQAKHDNEACSWTRTYFDGLAGVPHTIGVNGGLSGNIYHVGALTLSQCVLNGASFEGSNWALSLRGDVPGISCVLNASGCVIQAGTSGYAGQTPVSSATITQSGNFDYDTGAPITL